METVHYRQASNPGPADRGADPRQRRERQRRFLWSSGDLATATPSKASLSLQEEIQQLRQKLEKELSSELADERNTGESASQLLETETSERLQVEKELKEVQVSRIN